MPKWQCSVPNGDHCRAMYVCTYHLSQPSCCVCVCVFQNIEKKANTKKKIVLGEDSKKWVESRKMEMRHTQLCTLLYIYIYNKLIHDMTVKSSLTSMFSW